MDQMAILSQVQMTQVFICENSGSDTESIAACLSCPPEVFQPAEALVRDANRMWLEAALIDEEIAERYNHHMTVARRRIRRDAVSL